MKLAKVFWLFGRCGAGKTTLARKLHDGFVDRSIPVFSLDGDDMRLGLCSDLGFTSEARVENHRRIAEVARLALEQGMNVVVATMAPQHSQRDVAARVLDSAWYGFTSMRRWMSALRVTPKGFTSGRRRGRCRIC